MYATLQKKIVNLIIIIVNLITFVALVRPSCPLKGFDHPVRVKIMQPGYLRDRSLLFLLSHELQMPLDGVFDHLQGLFYRIALRCATRERRTFNPKSFLLCIWMQDDIIRLAFHGNLVSSVLVQFPDLA